MKPNIFTRTTLLIFLIFNFLSCKNENKTSSQNQKTFFKTSLAQWSIHNSIRKDGVSPYEFAKIAHDLGFEGLEYVNALYSDVTESEDKSSASKSYRNKFTAISLCNSGGTLTGITNDLGFENIYSEQIKYQANENDVFIGISGSGTSKNIIKGLKCANRMGLKTILITRNDSPEIINELNLLLTIKGDSNFPGQTGKNNNNFHFEDVIIKLSHIACGLLKMHVQGS